MRDENLYIGSLKTGEKAYVVGYDGDSSLFVRYSEIGMYPGSEIEVVRNQGSSLVVRVGGSKIALRGGVLDSMRVSFDKI